MPSSDEPERKRYGALSCGVAASLLWLAVCAGGSEVLQPDGALRQRPEPWLVLAGGFAVILMITGLATRPRQS